MRKSWNKPHFVNNLKLESGTQLVAHAYAKLGIIERVFFDTVTSIVSLSVVRTVSAVCVCVFTSKKEWKRRIIRTILHEFSARNILFGWDTRLKTI